MIVFPIASNETDELRRVHSTRSVIDQNERERIVPDHNPQIDDESC